MRRVLGIVPARAGSKRLPGKNVLPLGGRPLVSWALDAARASSSLTRVVLSSDSPEVLALCPNDCLPLRRPDSLATDTAPAIDYVRHALDELSRSGEAFDAICIVQPTSPFTAAQDIDAVVELLTTSSCDSAVSVQQVEHALHPTKLKRLEGPRLVPYLEDERGRMSEHELEKIFIRNGSVYASWAATIVGGSILGAVSHAYVMPRERSLDINDSIDFAFAEFLLARGRVSTST